MRVFITGGAGLLGRAIAEHLIERGYEVALTDIIAETDVPHTTYAVCNILDYDSVRENLRGCDAVVHMAAVRNPIDQPGHVVYQINTAGTFNVFEAAAKEGIRRIVQASSINAMGCAWNIGEFAPHYLPVDEDHPLATSDPYSFSKQQIEEIGGYFWRRDGISSVAFRFPGIYRAEMHHTPQSIERRHAMREFLDSFALLSQEERDQQIEQVRLHCMAFRSARRLEYPDGGWKIPPYDGIDDRLAQAYTMDRFNLWALLDVRDAALAVEQALTATFDGAHPLFVNDTHNSLDYDTQSLIRMFFPEVPRQKHPVEGSAALVSVKRAHDLIGFEPQYSVHGDRNVENS